MSRRRRRLTRRLLVDLTRVRKGFNDRIEWDRRECAGECCADGYSGPVDVYDADLDSPDWRAWTAQMGGV